MENAAPTLTAPEKGPNEIERDMATTRESITEKVAALETQVKGNIEAVTGTVEAVKDAIAAAPTAVSDTVKQTVAAVKDSVRETMDRLDVSACVRRNPWTALGTSTAAGFFTGLLLFGGRSRATSSVQTAFVPQAAAAQPREPGYLEIIFGDMFGKIGKELRDVVDQAFSSAASALKQKVGTVVPQLVNQAVQSVANPAAGSLNGTISAPRMTDRSGV